MNQDERNALARALLEWRDELQRDSWKRIAESGLGIPQTETASEAGMKDAPAWIDDGAGGLVNLGMALSKRKGDEA